MRKYLTGFLCVAIGLYVGSVSAATYNFVKTGTTGWPERMSFKNVAYDNGGKTYFNENSPLIAGDNLYAEDLVKVGSSWYCYYGGWLTSGQGNDKIYLGISDDGEPVGTWSPASQLTINNGVYTHVNDPSVQKVGAMWYMAYTTYQSSTTKDWINYSTSSDGQTWSPNAGSTSTEIAVTDPLALLGAGNTLTDIARPSLVKDGSRWLLYFDGRVNNGALHSYCATSTQTTPSSFTLAKIFADVESFPGFFEPDVERRPDGSFIAVYQRNYKKFFLATSANGLDFTGEKEIFDAANPPLNSPETWIDNPGLLYDAASNVYQGIMFGYTHNSGLTANQIGYAPAQWIIQISSPGSPDPVWHGFGYSQSLSEQTMYVFAPHNTSFLKVRLLDPVTQLTVYEQDFTSAVQGDIWTLQVFPGPTFWIGDLGTGDGINWNSWGNWTTDGINPAAAPTADTIALAINVPGYGPAISAAGAVAKSVEVGTWGWDGSLAVESAGTLAVGENVKLGITTGNTGILTNSGAITIAGALYVGSAFESQYGNGMINMNGGSLVVGDVNLIASAGVSHINLDGGTITAGYLRMNASPQDTMDITAGTLVVDGDVVGGVNFLAGASLVTAYGGWGTVNAVYNSGTNKTTITASPGAYGTAPAQDVTWAGKGYAKYWDRALNWYATLPTPRNAVPRTTDNAIIAGIAVEPNIPMIMPGEAVVVHNVAIASNPLATLIVAGGTLNCNELQIGWGGKGHLQLNAGTVTAVDLNACDPNTTIDIKKGVLILDGSNDKAKIDWLISIGKITAHDGAGCVWADYNVTNVGKTTVKAYDRLAGDLNGDCWVNLKDFAILAGNWLESSL